MDIRLKSYGVTIGDYHTYSDLGLSFQSKEIEMPSIQTKLVKVPLRNGSLDYSEVGTGKVQYSDRTVKITFWVFDKYVNWAVIRSKIANYLHGQKVKIVFDDDPNYYYYGRLSMSGLKYVQEGVAEVVFTATCDPYKYNITSSAERWLWDPFNFSEDVINQFVDVEVTTTCTVIITATQTFNNPIFTVNSSDGEGMDLHDTRTGETTHLDDGETILYDLELNVGINTFIMSGSGTFSINYVGGKL